MTAILIAAPAVINKWVLKCLIKYERYLNVLIDMERNTSVVPLTVGLDNKG